METIIFYQRRLLAWPGRSWSSIAEQTIIGHAPRVQAREQVITNCWCECAKDAWVSESRRTSEHIDFTTWE